MPELSDYELYWSPEGKRIATVKARTARAAKRKVPKPYRRYLGEVYAVRVECDLCGVSRSKSPGVLTGL